MAEKSGHPQAGPGGPTVAVVIPARNEAAYVARCIGSLAQQDYPHSRTTILLVDNGSADNTAAIAREHGVAVLHQPGGRVGAVRNRGARATESDVLAFLDADCVARPDWLSAAVAALGSPGTGIAGGGYLAAEDGTWVQRAWAPTTPGPTTSVAALPGGSIVMRRELFNRLQGFNEELSAGEDDDLCRRVREQGLAVISLRASWVVHLGYPRTLLAVARRQVWHGSNQLDVAESWREAQLLLTHSFAIGLVAAATVPWSGIAGAGAAALLLAPPVITMAASKAARRTDRLAALLGMLPVAAAFYAGRSLGLVKNYVRLLRAALSGR